MNNKNSHRYAEVTDLYLLRALTPTHVGSGDGGYGIIDKRVQRDPLNELPVIHASGLKGAFRELFVFSLAEETKHGKKIDGRAATAIANQHPLVRQIFGSPVRDGMQENGNKSKAEDAPPMQPGSHVFHEGHLLSLPVRSNFRPYYSVVCPEVLTRILELVKLFGITISAELKEELEVLSKVKVKSGTPLVFEEVNGKVYLEEFENEAQDGRDKLSGVELKHAKETLGSHIAMMSFQDFKSIAQRLPVIARNYLENGISENLWYEEVVPRETRFTFFLQHPKQDPVSILNSYFQHASEPHAEQKQIFELDREVLDAFQTFDKFITQASRVPSKVQVGGNATVGYGLCEVRRIN